MYDGICGLISAPSVWEEIDKQVVVCEKKTKKTRRTSKKKTKTERANSQCESDGMYREK